MKKSKTEKNWIMIEPIRGGARTKINKNELGIGFYKKILKKNPDGEIYGRICLGDDILKKMGWKAGDLVCIYYDRDNEKEFMLTKSEGRNGIKISKYNGDYSLINFRWDGETIINANKGKHIDIVKYTSNKKCVYFEAKF